MKRLLSFAMSLVLACCVCSAQADLRDDLKITYNSTAKVLGAPQLDLDTMIRSETDPGSFVFKMDGLLFAFQSTGSFIKAIGIYADEAHIADFLCSCMSVIWCFGAGKSSDFSSLLLNFGSARANRKPVPFSVGLDVCGLDRISDMEGYDYCFVYSNVDLCLAGE